MKCFSPSFTLAVGVASTVSSVLFVLTALKFVMDPRTVITNRRIAICEQLAIHCTLKVNQQESAELPQIVRAVCGREKGILSGAVRKADGTLMVEVGDHAANWTRTDRPQSTADQVQVPIVTDDKPWGTVEVRFQPLSKPGTIAYYSHLVPPYIAVTASTVFLLTFVYLSSSLGRRGNSTSAEIPDRVRATLDTLVEGVLVLDTNQKIALANKAFAKAAGRPVQDLEGRSAAKLPWFQAEGGEDSRDLPWKVSCKTGNPEAGAILGMESGNGRQARFSVNTTPVTDDDGACRGVLATFDDLTVIERKNQQLEDGIQRQREEIAIRERTEDELRTVQKQLVDMAWHAGMAKTATDMLHNIGNVLTTVNVGVSVLVEKLQASRVQKLSKVAELMRDHEEDLGRFLEQDARGQQVIGYLTDLSDHLHNENLEMLAESDSLVKHIEHIKSIVCMQQSYAKVTTVREVVSPAELVEDALALSACDFDKYRIEVTREFGDSTPVELEKQKLMQVLVNLIANAKESVVESGDLEKKVTLRFDVTENDRLRIEVEDNGVGIPSENLTRIFAHGFTTKTGGHGFGLHSCGNYVKQSGGSVTVRSDGPGKGACFCVEVPISRVREALTL